MQTHLYDILSWFTHKEHFLFYFINSFIFCILIKAPLPLLLPVPPYKSLPPLRWKGGVEKMNQLLKSLPLKHKNLSSTPSTNMKTRHRGTGKVEVGRYQVFAGPTSLVQISKLQMKDPENMLEKHWRHLISTFYLHVHLHTCVHMYSPTHRPKKEMVFHPSVWLIHG